MTIDLAAYYFPGFHADPRTSGWHGEGWSEWDVLRAATPRFPGHRQPIVPAWGEFDESDPEWGARQAQCAADHGIGVFIVDWYWYENGDFLNGALDRGLLGNATLPIDVALMWANHEWHDIHPAGSIRPVRALLSGTVGDAEFDRLAETVVERYFSNPNYYRIDGRPYFSIYEPQTFIDGFGSLSAAAHALDRLRERARWAGISDLHINLVAGDRGVLPSDQRLQNSREVERALGASSTGSYVWVHHHDPSSDGFPLGSYQRSRAANEAYWARARAEQPDLPYYPNVTMGWDSSPRTVQSDRFEDRDYPWTAILDGNTPQEFGAALDAAVDFARAGGTDHGAQRLVTINAWNEWTEGSYLLPDTEHGTAYLEQCRRVAHGLLGERNGHR